MHDKVTSKNHATRKTLHEKKRTQSNVSSMQLFVLNIKTTKWHMNQEKNQQP